MQIQAIKRAAREIAKWRDDPVAFVRDCFQVEPDAWQADFLMGYRDHARTAAKACKGPGKTTVLSWCAWHFLTVWPHAQIAATSITGDNLRDGLWKEMAKWQQRSIFLSAAFTWRAERIVSNDHPETWFMTARKWSKDATGEQQANALAGLHADHIMFIIDEAGGIPDSVMAAAEAIMANAGTEVNPNAMAKILICGNPTHLSGPLYRACSSEASLWNVIEITGDPDDPKRSPRISIQWARDQIKKYGADNPWVLVNVFGRFPPSSMNALLGPDDIERAFARTYRIDAYGDRPRILGVDVARQGDDATIIAPRQGIVAFRPKVLRIPNLVQVAGHVARAIDKFDPDGVFVDQTGGYGASVVDNLRDWGYPVVGVEFAGKALNSQYKNKRAEMAYEFAHWVKSGGALPTIPELKEEGTAITYFFSKDQVQIEEKDQIKERIGRSPDYFDAYGLTFAFPVAKKDPLAKFKRDNANTDYDPVKMHYREEGYNQTVVDYDPLK